MFIHFDMPRAAGDSLMDCVGRVYGHERILRIGWGIRYDMDIGTLMDMPDNTRDALKRRYGCFITKHTFPLQRLLHLPYVGFMRNPVDWYISSYFYARQTSLGDPSEPYGFAIDKYNFSLLEFVRWLVDIGHENIQLKNILALEACVTDGLPPRPACISVDQQRMSYAADFVRKSFAVFAPTEKFAEAVYALGALYNWPMLPLWQRKGSSGWRQDFVAPEGLMEYLKEQNALDCALFAQIDQDFDTKFSPLIQHAGPDIADYDECSRHPEFSDATPFHFFDLPDELIKELRDGAQCEGRDRGQLILGGMKASVKGDCLYGSINGHLIWSRDLMHPPFVALPSEATYGLDRDLMPQSYLFHPGALYAETVDDLRQRLLEGSVPSLVETLSDGMIWFYAGDYYLLDAGFYDKRLYDEPDYLLRHAMLLGGFGAAHQILQFLTDPFMLERLEGYAFHEPDSSDNSWRASPQNADGREYAAASRSGLIVAMMRDDALRFTVAPPLSMGSLGLYNLVQYNKTYYAVLQGEGDLLDLLPQTDHGDRLLYADSLFELCHLVMRHLAPLRKKQPRFIEVSGKNNIVAVGDVWLAVPQDLGSLNLSDGANHGLPGIVRSHSQKRLKQLLGRPAEPIDVS